MSKYIPALKIVDHFGVTKYEFNWAGSEPKDLYQDALDAATSQSYFKRDEKPVTRVDGLEYRDKSVKPVVLKEVEMIEKEQP